MLYIMDACTVAPLFRGADGPNCKDIMKGIAFSMPSCLCQDTAVFLVSYVLWRLRWGRDLGELGLFSFTERVMLDLHLAHELVYFKTTRKLSVRYLKLKIMKQYAIKLSENSNYKSCSYIY